MDFHVFQNTVLFSLPCLILGLILSIPAWMPEKLSRNSVGYVTRKVEAKQLEAPAFFLLLVVGIMIYYMLLDPIAATAGALANAAFFFGTMQLLISSKLSDLRKEAKASSNWITRCEPATLGKIIQRFDDAAASVDDPELSSTCRDVSRSLKTFHGHLAKRQKPKSRFERRV